VNASIIAAVAATACGLILLWLVFRYSFLVPTPKGLPILLYHKVSHDHEDALTISTARLDSQLAYIKAHGYQSISFADLKASLDSHRPLPAKPILLTFDDGYLNTYELACPLLRKHSLKATVFLPVSFIGKTNAWDDGAEPLMSYDQIRQLAGSQIEFGLHSYSHENYEQYSAAQVEADVSSCVKALENNGCNFTRVFSYPYGRMPVNSAARRALRDSFRRHNIDFAVRIGSRINALPPSDPYEIKRTCIDGTDSFREFKIKLRKGRVKLF
jgi:peptidoglycan/xylan/chitin deacetylase (PgdA/CDA1 family)